MSLPLGHQTWFRDAPAADDWSFLFEGTTLVLLAGATLVVLGIRAANHFRDGVDLPWLGRMAPWVPFIIRLHLAVSLVGLLSIGAYLSPAMDLQTTPLGILLGIVMAISAPLFAAGYKTRLAAWLLIAAGPLGMIEFGIGPVLQRIDLLGMAAFLLILGPGRWSADLELGGERDRFVVGGPGRKRIWQALLALRLAAGSALIIVALYEKLLNPDYAVEFLAHHGELQLATHLGLPLSDLEFVRLVGVIEIMFGLLLISGALPQLVILIAALPFNATLWFFGHNELVGHLPIYGAMLVILIIGSDPRLRPLLYRFRPPRQAAGSATAAGGG